MSGADCYVLHCYCDSAVHQRTIPRGEFTGANKKAAFHEAYEAGWKLRSDRIRELCPECARYYLKNPASKPEWRRPA